MALHHTLRAAPEELVSASVGHNEVKENGMWAWIRVGLVILSVPVSMRGVPPDSTVPWALPFIVALVTIPFWAVGAFVAVRVSTSGLGPKWSRNPFTSFVDFIHLGAWCGFTSGNTAVVISIMQAPSTGPEASTLLATGAAGIIGINLGSSFGESHVPNQGVDRTRKACGFPSRSH